MFIKFLKISGYSLIVLLGAVFLYFNYTAFTGGIDKVFYVHGIKYKSEGNLEKALTFLNLAVKIDPYDHEIYMTRGDVYFEIEEYENAISDYMKAKELYSGRWNLDKADKYIALANLSGEIAKDPGNAELYWKRACINLGKNFWFFSAKLDKAISDCTKAIELDPNFQEAYNTRGVAHSRKNSWMCKDFYDDAIADLKKAIELKPGDVIPYFNLAEALYGADRREEALETFLTYIKLGEPVNHCNVQYARNIVAKIEYGMSQHD